MDLSIHQAGTDKGIEGTGDLIATKDTEAIKVSGNSTQDRLYLNIDSPKGSHYQLNLIKLEKSLSRRYIKTCPKGTVTSGNVKGKSER